MIGGHLQPGCFPYKAAKNDHVKFDGIRFVPVFDSTTIFKGLATPITWAGNQDYG